MIVLLFLVTGICDMPRERSGHHISIIAASRVPYPAMAFWAGTAMKIGGCALLLADWHAEIGVYLLMLFIVFATAIYLRFWTIEEPMRRHMTQTLFLHNVGIMGGLLLLLDTLG